MNLIEGKLEGESARLGSFVLPVRSPANSEQKVTFGVRPENIVIQSGAPAEARVFDIEDQGVIKILALDMGDTRLHATVPAGTHVDRDEVVRFGWKPERVLSFDPETGRNLAI